MYADPNTSYSTPVFLKMYLEAAYDGILIVNEQGYITNYNQKFMNMWGIPCDVMESAVDQNVINYILPKLTFPSCFIETTKNIYENKKRKSKDQVEFLDGRTFERYTAPVHDENENYCGRIWYFRDISKDVLANRALQESADRFRLLSESVFDGVAITEKGIFLDTNSQFLQMVQYDIEELVGKPVYKIVAPRSIALVKKHIDLSSEETYEHFLRKKNNVIFPVLSRARAMVINGKKYRVTVITDITSQKETEKTLKDQADKLKQLSLRLSVIQEIERKAISRNLHDSIGQYLTALGLNISILKNSIPEIAKTEPVSERLADSSILIEKAARAVRDLTGELRPPVMDDFGLIAALHWYCRLFSFRTGIKYSFEVDDLHQRLETNIENTIFRVFQEILNNITKHAEATSIEIKGRFQNNFLHLKVSDDGNGFDIDKIKMDKNSLRWGLRTMEERLELIHGKVLISSEHGRGTDVVIEVPF